MFGFGPTLFTLFSLNLNILLGVAGHSSIVDGVGEMNYLKRGASRISGKQPAHGKKWFNPYSWNGGSTIRILQNYLYEGSPS